MPLKRTTPGVYIEKKQAFPNQIALVDTAIPAFIGYTPQVNPAAGAGRAGKRWGLPFVYYVVQYDDGIRYGRVNL